MKPTAWYDPTNGMVSADKDSPSFTPLGQVLPLYLEEQQITADCPQCDVIELPWVGLTVDELIDLEQKHVGHENLARAIEAKLKEKNNG